MNRPRIGTALVLSPLSTWLLFTIPAPFIDGGAVLLAIGFVAVIVAYAGMLFVGLPIILVFNRFGLTKWWQVTLAGAPVPAILTWQEGGSTSLTFGLFGAYVALVAWFIAFYQVRDAEGPSGDVTHCPTEAGV